MLIPKEDHTCACAACLAIVWWLADLEGVQAFSCMSKSPLGVTESLGLGRLGAKNAALEARVQVLNPVTPTCSVIGDLLRGVVERQCLLGWMTHSLGHGSLKHIPMSFRASWNDVQV